jgi:hypothetical protein
MVLFNILKKGGLDFSRDIYILYYCLLVNSIETKTNEPKMLSLQDLIFEIGLKHRYLDKSATMYPDSGLLKSRIPPPLARRLKSIYLCLDELSQCSAMELLMGNICKYRFIFILWKRGKHLFIE